MKLRICESAKNISDTSVTCGDISGLGLGCSKNHGRSLPVIASKLNITLLISVPHKEIVSAHKILLAAYFVTTLCIDQ